MLYYLTKHLMDQNFSLPLEGAEEVYANSGRKFTVYKTQLSENYLVDQTGRKVPPVPGDVVILGDERYGIRQADQVKGEGKDNLYKLVLRQLSVEEFSKERSFNIS